MPLAFARVEKPPYRIPLMGEIKAVPRNGLRFVSTFSGCGGSGLGFEMAGWTQLLSSEFVEAAQDVHLANFPDVPVIPGDVRDVDVQTILDYLGLERGELDLLEGSPPCASFSTAGKRSAGWGEVKTYSDTAQRTDDLFFEFVRLLDGLYPRAFAAENVTGLVKGVAIGYFKLIVKALEEVGYRVKAQVLDASWLGVPQARQRVIFVGVREDLGIEPPDVKELRYLPYQYTVRDAIPLAVRHGTAPPHKDWHAVGMDPAQTMVDSAREPAPTIVASGENKGAGWVEIRTPVAVVHDTSGQWSLGDVSDGPCPTITVGVNSLNSQHFQVEEEVVRIPVRVVHEATSAFHSHGDVTDEAAPTVPADVSAAQTFTVEEYTVPLALYEAALAEAVALELDVLTIPLDRSTAVEPPGKAAMEDLAPTTRRLVVDPDLPAPTVQAMGMGDSRLTQVYLPFSEEGEAIHQAQLEDADISRYAIGEEWDKLQPGEQSERFFSLVKPSLDKPSPTITAATATATGAAAVVHPLERRKFTIPELKRICGFPDDFILTGNYRQQWERLGRAVPPPMMQAVASCIAELLLEADA